MFRERKRPHWPLLTAALIGLPVLYFASYGPVSGAYVYGLKRDWFDAERDREGSFLRSFYRPYLWLDGTHRDRFPTD